MMCRSVIVCVLSVLTLLANAVTFTVTPSPQVVGVGQQAVFRCLHPSANVDWAWNGSVLIEADLPEGIAIGRAEDETGNVAAFTLTVEADLNYNQTEVVCLATVFVDLSSMTEKTLPVNFTIQGPLSMVTDVRRNFSSILWEPPFSLNLTNVDPNIVYCVEVVNITCGAEDLVVGDCDVTEPSYLENSLQQGHIYRIAITPRSNGQNAQNGSDNTKEEMFVSLTYPKTSIMLTSSSSTVSAVIQLTNNGTVVGGIQPDSYALSLAAIDGIEDPPDRTSLATSFTRDMNTTTLEVNQRLPRNRLWNYRILALDCVENPITKLFELGTHDIRNVTVSSSSPGEISVTGNFINGSTARAIFAIIYSDSGSDVYYTFSLPSSEEEKLSANISGLPSGLYNVSVFVVADDGLPFPRSATTPRSISVMEGLRGTFLIEYEVQSTSTGVCITCTFLDSSTASCVAVVHQQISQLSSSGLMNIQSSHRFNRSGDTAYGCIEGVNLEQYQVGVVGGSLAHVQPNEDGSRAGLIAGATVGTILAITLVLFMVFILWKVDVYKKIRERWSHHSRQAVHCSPQKRQQQLQPGDSSSMKPLTTPPDNSQDEDAYDVLWQGAAKPPEFAGAKNEGVESAALYSVLDTHPPQSVQGINYSSVNLGPPSGIVGHDDLHKTTTQYSTLQHEPQQESSFNEGAAAGNADNRSCENDDTTHFDQTLGFRDECMPVSFHSIQGPTMVTELTTLGGDQNGVVNEEARISATQCTDPSTFSVMTTRSNGTYEEWQHKIMYVYKQVPVGYAS